MWGRFLRAFAITGAVSLGLSLALILLMDPLGVSPVGIAHDLGPAFEDRRFAAPRLIEEGQFDSFLVGTSTIHSVDPRWAEEAFGGRFANIAIHGATPHEMTEVIRLIGRSVPSLRRVILGIDASRWCKPEGFRRYNEEVAFPDWRYDESRLNDLPRLFNLEILERSFDQFRVLLGLKSAKLPANGYRNQLVDAKWNAAKAKTEIYGARGIAALDVDEAESPPGAGQKVYRFPDLDLLEAALATLPPKAEFIGVIMPSHVAGYFQKDRDIVATCKRALEARIGRSGGAVIDFRIPSIWTRNDDNYWDRNHIRVGLAHDLILRVKEAMERRRDAGDGVYRVLATTVTRKAAGAATE